MDSEFELSSEETRVYEIIKRETKASGGIKQTQIRKHSELRDLDPKKITQIVRKLTKMNLVDRILVNEGGKRHYLLIAKEEKEESAQNMVTKPNESILAEPIATTSTAPSITDIDVNLLDIPCMKCKHVFECGIGRPYDPLRCPLITQFILEKSGVIYRS
jgi:DNA-binding MarR family transcriptional regulator